MDENENRKIKTSRMRDKKSKYQVWTEMFSKNISPSTSYSPTSRSNPQIPFWKLALSNYVDIKRKIVGTLSWALLVISSHFYRIGFLLLLNSCNGSSGSFPSKRSLILQSQCFCRLEKVDDWCKHFFCNSILINSLI